jgi:hypothetical protein
MTSTEKELDRKPPTILEQPAKPAPVLDDDGLGPTNEDEDGFGLPADESMDSVEQSVTRDKQSARVAASGSAGEDPSEEVDETSAGGLHFPDDRA